MDANSTRAASALAVLLFAVPIGAQVAFDNWTAESGLPQNIIRGIHQSADGYLWVATFNGLARFDGVRFTIFNKSNSPGMESGRFSSMYGEAAGDLWLATDGGGVTRYRNGVFATYSVQHGLPNRFTWAVHGDGKGKVWAVSADSIVAWDDAKSRFTEFLPANPGKRTDLTWWEDGGFWRVHHDELLCFWRGQLLRYPLPKWLPGASIQNVARDQSGAYWIETYAGNRAIVQGTASGFEIIAISNQRTCQYRDRRGRLWEFGVSRGLKRYLKLDENEISFSLLYEDREGNIWLATEGQGLYRVRQPFITSISKEQGLIARNIYPIYEDRRGAVWIGAWGEGLSRYQDGAFTNYTSRNGLANAVVTALAEDRKGRIWVAANEDLRYFENGRFHKANAPRIPPRTTVFAMFQEPDGTFWFGTGRGLLRYRDGTSTLLTVQDGLATNDVRLLVPNRNGGLWIAGYGGLTRLRDGKFTRWTHKEGLPLETIRSIYEDSEGVVWIGSYDDGVSRFQNGKFTHYTASSGLPNNGAFQILEDARGNLWMSSNRGIYRVSKRELNEVAAGTRAAVTATAYGRGDGMRNVECNGGYWPAGVKTQDGKLWFPTQDGAAIVDTEAIPVNTNPPPVMIESFLLDRTPVALDGPIRIAPGQENFEIQYTALSFIKSGQLRFRYRLEGLDSDWVDAGMRRTAYYSHAPPGNYTFRVTARNSDGVWNETGKSLSILVLAPFYRTWWFGALLSVISAAVIHAAWRYRERQFERLQAVQHAFSRQLIASQEGERKRIAAELHDSLGQRLIVMKNLAALYLRAQREQTARNGNLQQIEEISSEASLAIHETREISYNLRPFQLDRLGLTKAVEALIRTASNASGICFVSALDDIDDVFPEELRISFYRIVQECVNNIIKHSHASEARVSVKRNGSAAVLEVRDNGRGFAVGGHSGRPSLTGFGLTGMAERASLLGGDLRIRPAPGGGVIVAVTIDTAKRPHG